MAIFSTRKASTNLESISSPPTKPISKPLSFSNTLLYSTTISSCYISHFRFSDLLCYCQIPAVHNTNAASHSANRNATAEIIFHRLNTHSYRHFGLSFNTIPFSLIPISKFSLSPSRKPAADTSQLHLPAVPCPSKPARAIAGESVLCEHLDDQRNFDASRQVNTFEYCIY